MIVTYDWLKEFIPTKLSPEDLAYKLTMIGLEVEGLHQKGNDWILDVNLTPNKADSLSVFGIAREVSLFDDASLKKTDPDISKFAKSSLVPDIVIENPELCGRYTGIIIENIKVAEPVAWMKERLENCGIRAINTIVDATNYVLLEFGHPLHSFDYDLLAGRKIIARAAKKGEKLKTLDGSERDLSPAMLVIADARQPVALAGVMGGANSEINNGTKNILLEAAYFDPVSIRKSSRKLGMHTEASHRFERGADYDSTVRAILRTAEIILQLNPGAKVSVLKDVYPKKFEKKTVVYRNARYEKIIGVPVSFKSALEIITRFGAEVIHADEVAQIVTIGVPSYRPDIELEIDIIEEIARVTGFDKVPVLLPEAQPAVGMYADFRKEYDAGVALRYLLKGAGLREAVNYSFVPSEFGEKYSLICGKPVGLKNPLDSTQNILRTELMTGLLQSLQTNNRFMNNDVGFFEIGNVFSFNKENKVDQELKLGFLLSGHKFNKSGQQIAELYDFYDLKGLIEMAIGYFHLKAEFKRAERPFLQKGKTADVFVNGKSIGFLGELDYQKRDMLDLKGLVLLAEISLVDLLSKGSRDIKFQALEKFHPIHRDLSVVVPQTIDYAVVETRILNHPAIERADLIDIFKGGNLADGEVSLTFSIKIRNNKDKAMSESDINGCMSDLIKDLTEGLKLRLR